MPNLKAFRVSGEFMMGKGWQPFSKECASENEKECAELICSILGSNHKVKRKFIRIRTVERIKKVEDIKDPVVRERLRSGAKK